MRAVIYNHDQSKTHPTGDAMCLRTAMLIASEICYCGHGYSYLSFSKFYAATSLMEKAKTLLEVAGKDDPGFTDYIHRSIAEIKFYNSSKGKSKEVIVSFKKLEHTLNNLYDLHTKYMVALVESSGISQLEKLMERDYFTGVFQAVGESEQENAKDNSFPMSKVLTLEMTCHPDDKELKTDNPPVFFLTPEFLTENVYRERIKKEKNIDFIPRYKYAHKLITMQNPIRLSFNELSQLRVEFEPHLKNFQFELDEWLRHVYANEKEGEEILKEKVLPICASIEKMTDESMLLNQFNNSSDQKYYIEVIAGEMLPEDIWNYYYSFKAISDDTKARLDELLNSNPKYKNNFPFIAIKASASENVPLAVEENETVTSSKKNLSLD